MAKIKICGLTKPEEAKWLNENHADYAGMVLFFPKSKRNITIEQGKNIMHSLDSEIIRVAVVVSPDIEQVRQIQQAGYERIQIHGNLESDVLKEIHIPIWKAFNVKDIGAYESYRQCDKIEGFVFDAAQPGSGKVFDWNLLKKIPRDDDKCFILAGGLSPENVKEAIDDICPDIVDVSSGVEKDEGRGKDPEKIKQFIERARKAVERQET